MVDLRFCEVTISCHIVTSALTVFSYFSTELSSYIPVLSLL